LPGTFCHALSTQATDLKGTTACLKTVFRTGLGQRALEARALELDHPATPEAHQMIVAITTADRLVVSVALCKAQLAEEARVGHVCQKAVDGCS